MNNQRPLTDREIELLAYLYDKPDGVTYAHLKGCRFGKRIVIHLAQRGLLAYTSGRRALFRLSPAGQAVLAAATAAHADAKSPPAAQ